MILLVHDDFDTLKGEMKDVSTSYAIIRILSFENTSIYRTKKSQSNINHFIFFWTIINNHN